MPFGHRLLSRLLIEYNGTTSQREEHVMCYIPAKILATFTRASYLFINESYSYLGAKISSWLHTRDITFSYEG